MKPGVSRFQHFLNQVEEKLSKVRDAKEPQLALYNDDLRTPFFMLESLCRIYRKLHNTKKFEKLLVKFKEVEDAIGAVDYYDTMAKWATENNQPEIAVYFKKHFEKSSKELFKILKKRDWIKWKKGASRRVRKIRKKLSDLDFESQKTEPKIMADFLAAECKKIDEKSRALDLNELEDGIHEFRRNVRWVSIYAQSLNGFIQLKISELRDPSLQYYLEDDIVNSPFNKLPPRGNGPSVQIDADLFYALSFIIARIGDQKDEGQIIEALYHYFLEIGDNESTALEKAEKISGTPSLNEIKTNCKSMVEKFQNDNILNKLAQQFKV